MSSPSRSHKRKSPRRPFPHAVGVLFRGHYTVGFGVQIGEGGMMLELDSNLTVGASIVLSFVLPGFGHAVSQATVLQESPLADTDARRLGCQFVNLDERFRQLIRQYVAARRREENVFVEADV